jgi:hypothetical protein
MNRTWNLKDDPANYDDEGNYVEGGTAEQIFTEHAKKSNWIPHSEIPKLFAITDAYMEKVYGKKKGKKQ